MTVSNNLSIDPSLILQTQTCDQSMQNPRHHFKHQAPLQTAGTTLSPGDPGLPGERCGEYGGGGAVPVVATRNGVLV